MRALVIDDSRAMRAILRQILKDVGFEDIAEASHGREALDRLKENKPILALVDWNMPEMDGYQFVQAVRAQPAYNDVRLMMVTTETEKSQVEKALAAGANEYVMKPFTKDVILEKLVLMGIPRQGGAA